MKTKWFKQISIILTLLFCMSVIHLPALAVDDNEGITTPAEYDAQTPGMDVETGTPPEYDGQTIEAFTWGIPGLDVLLKPDPGEAPQAFTETTQITLLDENDFRPFTPPGTGTVLDNATDGNEKEFYTITTDEGDVFYLIIDRQRNNENVYFLNAVTIDDLIALAEKSDRKSPNITSASPPTELSVDEEQSPAVTPEPETDTEPPSSNSTMYIVICVAAVGVGGAAYYFKIVKGKKDVIDEDEDYGDDEDEYGYEEEPEPDDDSDNSKVE